MIVIFNPTAGRRRAHALWRVLDVLSANGMRLELAETQHAGHATELARDAVRSGAKLIVAAGGDGTIAEVANGMAGGSARLGVIPLGTANVLAHELRLPFAPQAVAAALAFGRTCMLWPGVATLPGETRLFVQMLGVGLDAQVVHGMSAPLKRLLGKGAYVAQTVREMSRYRYPKLRIRLDGEEMDAASVIVSKGRLYAGRFTLAPHANACLPGFSVAVFERYGTMAAMMYGAALPLNLLPRMPGLRIESVSAVEILGDGGQYAQADGDPAGATPISIRNAASPIEVVVS
ncbi:diacylglycerol kinase family protein [Acidisphaera sp. L21]|uniref:diacylglycerol/lipid kinase family protein n=1 Tax=Acidisphaera sp. L21 TaxID=1641851 RepID=UPI00131AECBF|nr:diacylglycerol kinase family protein [Acidisphaera sp. L21]